MTEQVITALRRIFPALTPPDKKADARVAIAQDVLDTLEIGRMEASRNHGYMSVHGHVKSVNTFEDLSLALRRKGGKTSCRVCAIGAAALCAIGLYDEAPYDDIYWSGGTMRDVLSRWFSRKQLDLIESAYEMDKESHDGGSSDGARERAVAFGVRYVDPRERLEAIMQNIIRNKGSFRP